MILFTLKILVTYSLAKFGLAGWNTVKNFTKALIGMWLLPLITKIHKKISLQVLSRDLAKAESENLFPLHMNGKLGLSTWMSLSARASIGNEWDYSRSWYCNEC